VKISVSSYSLSRLVNSGDMTLMDVIDWLADHQVKGVEFSGLGTEDPKEEKKIARKIVARCKKRKMTITSFTIGANLLQVDEKKQAAEIERVKQKVDIGGLLGAKRMRHDVAGGFPKNYKGDDSWETALKYIAPACRQIADHAKKYKIITSMENHGHFAQASQRVLKLVKKVNHPNFGITIDIGNFMCVDENSVDAVRRLAKYASHVHAKDFHYKSGKEDPGPGWFGTTGGNYLRGAIVGHGVVDVPKCLSLIKKAGFKGWYSIEFEGLEDPRVGVAMGINNLRRYLKQA